MNDTTTRGFQSVREVDVHPIRLAAAKTGKLSGGVLVDGARAAGTTLGEHDGSNNAVDVSEVAPGVPGGSLEVTRDAVVLSTAVTSLVEGQGELVGAGVLVEDAGSSGEVELGDGVASIVLVNGELTASTLGILKVEQLDDGGIRGDGQGNGRESGNNGELHFCFWWKEWVVLERKVEVDDLGDGEELSAFIRAKSSSDSGDLAAHPTDFWFVYSCSTRKTVCVNIWFLSSTLKCQCSQSWKMFFRNWGKKKIVR